MPQIAQLADTYASQIFWLLLTFGFVFFVVGLGMVPKIQGTVDAREGKIAKDLETAKAATERADAIEEEYRTRSNESRAAAQALIVDAKSKATKATEKQLATADARIADILAKAEAEVKAASNAALTEIETVAADAAQDMVAKISGAKASPTAARAAVKAALAHG